MTARSEVEEILEAGVWAERNGLDPSIVITPHTNGQRMAELREYERKNYRDHPMWDAYDDMPLVSVRWLKAISVVISSALLLVGWLLRGWLLHR